MCSKLKLNTTLHRSGAFIVDFEQSEYINIVFLLLTLNKYLVIRVRKTSHNVLKTQKVTYLFRNKSCKAYFIQRFIIAPG